MARKTKMNSITSPELLEKIHPDNKTLMRDFLDYLRTIGRSEKTILSYENDLHIAFVWCLQNNDNKPFTQWTKRNIIAYQYWLMNTNENSPARIRRLKASLSSLSNYIEVVLDDEYPGFRNIINKVSNPPLQAVRDKTVWEIKEIEDLLTQLVEQRSYKKACCVALAAFGGRRKAEICRFRVDDFNKDRLVCDGALYKSAPILTKGNKYLECYTLAKRFQPYLDLWMAERERLGIDSAWLFPDTDDPGQQIQISTLNSWAATFTKMTGRNFYWHSLRHHFVSMLAKAGIPDNVVVQILGWATAEMFNVYNDNSKDDQLSQYFKDGDISVQKPGEFGDIG